MITPQQTIAAISTPPGTGAIAIIRLSGPDAIRIAETVFVPAGKDKVPYPSNQVIFGTISDGEKIIDEVLLTCFRTPHSFTGEDVVEISCHGSVYIQNEVLQLLIRNGARAAEPGEFSMRAFLNRKMDLTQAEAIGDLIAADTKAAHQLALNQMRGGFSHEIKELRTQLIHFASLLELELDFSEEDVEFANRGQLMELINATIQATTTLSDSFRQGNVIRNGVPVAIAGKPNVGKSTLLNLILNEERAIVSDIAGTTRDTVEEEITLGGIKYRFIDTAGIRHTTDAIEMEGVGRSHEKIKRASVIIYLFDPGETDAQELLEILNRIRESKQHENYILIPVANKTDRYNLNYLGDQFRNVHDIVFISAKLHSGINELFDRITAFAEKGASAGRDVILTNIRHKEAMDRTTQALVNAREGLSTNLATDLIAIEIRSALMHLGELTGEITTEDLLDNIFSKFCIGK